MGFAFILIGTFMSLLSYFSDLFSKSSADAIYMLSALSLFFGLVCLTSPKRVL